MSACGVRGIRVAFGGSVALDGVTLDVPDGRVTALVGGDGAGKTTLLRVLAGRVGVQEGEVRTLAKREIGYQPSTSGVWGGLSVDENIAFVGQAFGMPRSALRARADDLLAHAGLADARHRLGRELSGGMRQKLGFVLAILHEPRLVLLDEPSTGVDPVSRVELWQLIAESAAAGTAVLLATTYLDEAARAESVTALDGGIVIAEGTPEQIVASVPGRVVVVPRADGGAAEPPPRSWRRGAERRRWLAPDEVPGVAPGGAVAVDLEDALTVLTLAREAATRGETRAAAASTRSRAAAASTRSRAAGGARRSPAFPGRVLVQARGLTRRFGAQIAVDEVSLRVARGEIVGLIGANGAGKTTLLRSMIGLDVPDGGDALLFGAPPAAAPRERLGYVPQGLGLSPTISAKANAEFFARVYGTPLPALPSGLRNDADAPVGRAGLGLQRQLAFALALAHEPDLLVLDEPTSGVDPLSRARLWDAIHAEADAGVGVIVTTHYLQEAAQCTRLVLLSRGRVVGAGSVDELTSGIRAVVVRAEQWQRAFATLTAAGLPTMLDGRSVRIAGVDPADVRVALGDLPARIEEAPPTLEEAMVLRERATVDG